MQEAMSQEGQVKRRMVLRTDAIFSWHLASVGPEDKAQLL